MRQKCYTIGMDTPEWFTGNPDEFNFTYFEQSGEELVLIHPKPDKAVGDWFENDKNYRSSIWRVRDGYPVSLGYRKFVNFEERPYFEPVDSFKRFVAMEKVDGSCLICSKHRGHYFFRTRGTVDARVLENGAEVDDILKAYPIKQALDDLNGDGDAEVTLLFEWITPTRVLCVRYEELDVVLTGVVVHDGYRYYKQDEADALAEKYGFRRPRRYEFDGTAKQASLAVLEWLNQEGVVCYFGDDQQVLKKMKSEWHHHMHIARNRMLCSDRKLWDFLDSLGAWSGEPHEEEVDRRLGETLEHEVVSYYKSVLQKFYRAYRVFWSRQLAVKELIKDATGAEDILRIVREHPEWPPTYIWNVFRDTQPRRTFVRAEMLEIVEKKLQQ